MRHQEITIKLSSATRTRIHLCSNSSNSQAKNGAKQLSASPVDACLHFRRKVYQSEKEGVGRRGKIESIKKVLIQLSCWHSVATKRKKEVKKCRGWKTYPLKSYKYIPAARQPISLTAHKLYRGRLLVNEIIKLLLVYMLEEWSWSLPIVLEIPMKNIRS